jgi:hypothetical protein
MTKTLLIFGLRDGVAVLTDTLSKVAVRGLNQRFAEKFTRTVDHRAPLQRLIHPVFRVDRSTARMTLRVSTNRKDLGADATFRMDPVRLRDPTCDHGMGLPDRGSPSIDDQVAGCMRCRCRRHGPRFGLHLLTGGSFDSPRLAAGSVDAHSVLAERAILQGPEREDSGLAGGNRSLAVSRGVANRLDVRPVCAPHPGMGRHAVLPAGALGLATLYAAGLRRYTTAGLRPEIVFIALAQRTIIVSMLHMSYVF